MSGTCTLLTSEYYVPQRRRAMFFLRRVHSVAFVGAVSGMAMLLGLSRGWDTLDKDEKEELYAREREMAEKFREKAGSIVCRDLIAEHPHGDTHNSMKPYCKRLVGLAASIVEESGIFAGEGKEKI